MINYLPGFSRFLQVLQGLSNKSVEAYCKKVKEFLGWMDKNGNGKLFHEITRKDIEGYLEWCYYRSNSNITRLTKLTALSKFFRYLKYEGLIPEDITTEVPKPKIYINRIQIFTKDEVLNFFKAIDLTREKGLRDACIFIMAAFCGLRQGEILKLRLSDAIDDEGYVDVAIPEDIGKKHSSRTIYLWKAPSIFVRQWYAVRLSQGAKAKDPLFISYRWGRPSGRSLDSSALNHILQLYAGKAGIRKTRITWHMFRATHISNLRHIQGYDIAAIAERAGHKNIATTDRYLPKRGRIHRTYSSLAAYWSDFPNIWKKKDDNNGDKEG